MNDGNDKIGGTDLGTALALFESAFTFPPPAGSVIHEKYLLVVTDGETTVGKSDWNRLVDDELARAGLTLHERHDPLPESPLFDIFERLEAGARLPVLADLDLYKVHLGEPVPVSDMLRLCGHPNGYKGFGEGGLLEQMIERSASEKPLVLLCYDMDMPLSMSGETGESDKNSK